MIDGKFDVVFRGQTIKNMALDEVKSNLVGLFKSSPEAVEKLFCGNEVAIKKSLDYTTAMKYLSALKKAGALALIKEIESQEPATSQISAPSQGKANFGSESATATSDLVPPTSVDVQTRQPQPVNLQTNQAVEADKAQEASSDGEISLAAVGAAIMPDKVYEKRDIDTSDLSLAAAGERILPKKPPEHHSQPSIDHLKLED